MNSDFDGIRTSANRPKRLQWPKRMSLTPKRARSAQAQATWLLCYLRIFEIKFETVKLTTSLFEYSSWLVLILFCGTYSDNGFHQNYHRSGSPHRTPSLDGCIAPAKHTKMTGKHALKCKNHKHIQCLTSQRKNPVTLDVRQLYSLGSLMAVITSLNPLLSVPQLSVTYFNVTKLVCVNSAPTNCFVFLHDTLYFCWPTAFAPS